MKKEIIRSQRLGEEYIRVEHPSGLTILLYPTPKLASTYALFATKYGSIDNSFRRSDESEFVTVPEGIAHYLEHKMFDCKDGDAFSKYAKTGANANAYTSFDKTAYLFSCTDHFEESLRILLEFVTEPYFTEASVAKEQGIIGQEIGMYDDDPDWQVYFNLLGALYQEHPLRIDIAGTVDTIAKINADLLYRCYDCFYNLHNMVLSVAGNFDPDAALRLCDEILQPAAPITVERAHVSEPEAVRTHRVDVSMPVATTMFQVGFKGVSADEKTNYENQIIDEVINEIVAGEGSALYRELYDQGLINNTFGTEVMCGRDYMALIFGGESKDPDKVYEAICREFDRLKAEGVSAADFERCKKALYGKYIGIFSSSSSIATVMMETHFFGLGAFDVLEVLSRPDTGTAGSPAAGKCGHCPECAVHCPSHGLTGGNGFGYNCFVPGTGTGIRTEPGGFFHRRVQCLLVWPAHRHRLHAGRHLCAAQCPEGGCGQRPPHRCGDGGSGLRRHRRPALLCDLRLGDLPGRPLQDL